MPHETITICGRAFTVPVPDRYVAGQTLELTEGEASSIRQTFCENVRNNLAGRMKKLDGFDTTLAETLVAEWQTKVDAYASEYAFGVRAVGGGRVAVDPETRETLSLIRDAIRTELKRKYGPKHGRTSEQVNEAAQRVLDSPKSEKFRRIAKQRLRQAADAATDILEGMDEAAE
jgi:hypothetical protein